MPDVSKLYRAQQRAPSIACIEIPECGMQF